MVISDETLVKIETSLFEAAIEAKQWAKAIAKVIAATHSTGAATLPIRGLAPGIPMSESVGNLQETYFREGWSVRDKS